MRVLFDTLFRDRDTLIGGRLGRWLVAFVALAPGAFLVFAPTSTERETSLNQPADVGLLALGALTLQKVGDSSLGFSRGMNRPLCMTNICSSEYPVFS